MFSGIVETTGYIQSLIKNDDCVHFSIQSDLITQDIKIGDSIAINGVCLTATAIHGNVFNVTAVPETLRVTNLGDLKAGDTINLERSLKFNDRIDGHLVQGHVDAVGVIANIQPEGDEAILVTINIPSSFSKYLINKGYITLDGMSITIIEAKQDQFTITLIPHTQAVTIAKHYQVGTRINIEVDMMGKYIEKLIGNTQHA